MQNAPTKCRQVEPNDTSISNTNQNVCDLVTDYAPFDRAEMRPFPDPLLLYARTMWCYIVTSSSTPAGLPDSVKKTKKTKKLLNDQHAPQTCL